MAPWKRRFNAARTFATMTAAPPSVSPGKLSGSGSMCNFPRVSIGTSQTTTVSELASLAVLGGLRLFVEFCREPLLCHPFIPFRAHARAAAFLWFLARQICKGPPTRCSCKTNSLCDVTSTCGSHTRAASPVQAGPKLIATSEASGPTCQLGRHHNSIYEIPCTPRVCPLVHL